MKYVTLKKMTSESSAMCRVSDNEMSYFQRRAREMLLLRREDHAWKEFCKTCTACDCISCRGTAVLAEQTSAEPPKLVKNTSSATRTQSKTLQTLNEIKTKLGQIDLALSKKTLPLKNSYSPSQASAEIKLPRSLSQTETSKNPTNVKHIDLIEKCLKQSIQRLQSSAPRKVASPQPSIKSNRGFFLPRELQQQRTIARNAYLASLSKSKSSLQPSSLIIKEKTSNKELKKRIQEVKTRGKVPKPKVIHKTRPKITLQSKIKETAKEGSSSQPTVFEDRNIEAATDGIVDDLVGETVLLLNRIRQKKSGTSNTLSHQAQVDKDVVLHIPSPSKPVNKENAKSGSLQNWTKIRQTPFNLKLPKEENTLPKTPHLSHQDNHPETSNQMPSQSQSTLAKTSIFSDPVRLTVDPETSSSIERNRRDYARHLDKVARARKGNFDPCTLANMISEFLLDECIESVSKELVDIPGSLITDLCDQEFFLTL
ncbi:hypothetical protein JTE90_024083 [Oedothorax gibbosus]|uniref:Uncharacterized protein n=1 Tax=Oedothorax gibbosus TaxID=931172 RepID=A0AAV6UR87_9ARAC|nr:hypothetical protein JTE90_024083 [Oedothorax gibbosus]